MTEEEKRKGKVKKRKERTIKEKKMRMEKDVRKSKGCDNKRLNVLER
jgi:hypothetical protein